MSLTWQGKLMASDIHGPVAVCAFCSELAAPGSRWCIACERLMLQASIDYWARQGGVGLYATAARRIRWRDSILWWLAVGAVVGAVALGVMWIVAGRMM